jgi:hypothetical protein
VLHCVLLYSCESPENLTASRWSSKFSRGMHVKNVPELENYGVWGAAFGRGVHHWQSPALN